jgi:putative spermidine/putrescine transport system substrate-binding protein
MRLSTTRGTRAALAVAATLSVVALAGCAGSGGDSKSAPGTQGFTPPKVAMQKKVGNGEGAVSILAWPGYAEDGSTDKSVDWVTPFEKATGCKATVKYFNTSDEAVNLMKGGQYDVVSASGDATLRLVAGGDVAPVNTDLVPNYKDVAPFLKDQQFNSVKHQMYGIPHGWGANLLMFRKADVKTAPTSWSAVFDDASQYKGKVTAYDSPIYIADAALYLMKHQPDLKIKDPYALDEGGIHRVVGHLDGRGEVGPPELRLQMDGLHHLAEGQCPGGGVLR